MIKKILISCVVFGQLSYSQVGIGTQAPKPSAILELTSTNRGFLPPRMTQAQYETITDPEEALVVYCTDCLQKGLRIYNGTIWEDMAGNRVAVNTSLPHIATTTVSFAIGTSVTFTATSGTWSGSTISYTYQWFLNGIIISGATNATFTTNVNEGNYNCSVTAINAVGSSTAINSNNILVYSSPPINTTPPTNSFLNSVFSCTQGTWNNATNYSYLWKKEGVIISGATTPIYNIQATDYGYSFSCEVTAMNNIANVTVNTNIINVPIGTDTAGAYSLRKVTPTATFAIKVRRSSDNTTQDIGFDGFGNLDTVALASFIGSSNGFVDTWYDQSSNARNIVQATVANQPQIASAGVVFVRNGKPVVRFNGTSNVLSNTKPWMYDNGAITALAVVIGNTSSNTGLLSETSSTSTNPVYSPISTGASNALTVFARGNSATPLLWSSIQTGVFNNTYKSISIQDSGSTFVATNGTTVSSPFAYSRATNVGVMDPTNRFSIGAWVRTTNGQFWTGDISEILLYTSVLSDGARDHIKLNQTSYYGL